MLKPNMYYDQLKESYLFYNIAQKTKKYLELHPEQTLLRMGIGDVSLPLCDAVIRALHEAVNEQAEKESFHGYMPECGALFLREAITEYYKRNGIRLSADEVFVSSGASDELGDLLQEKFCACDRTGISGLCGCQYDGRQGNHSFDFRKRKRIFTGSGRR